MNIFYWQSPSGNFGDDLNEWIWDDLLPGWRAWDPSRTLVGVGTILSASNFPEDGKYLVCGSGAGFGQPPDASDKDRWRIAFVRGRKTAAMLNIPEELAMSDPAVVLPRLARFSSRQQSRGMIFIPHCHSDASPIYDWKRICARAGVEHLSPRRDSHQVIRAISSATSVITESMHGAIIADAFRIPWKPVSLVQNFNPLKWLDWGEGLDLDFEILPLPRPIRKKRSIKRALSRLARPAPSRKSCKWGGVNRSLLEDVDFKKTGKRCVSRMQELKGGEFYLSKDADLLGVQERIVERLSALRSAYD